MYRSRFKTETVVVEKKGSTWKKRKGAGAWVVTYMYASKPDWTAGYIMWMSNIVSPRLLAASQYHSTSLGDTVVMGLAR